MHANFNGNSKKKEINARRASKGKFSKESAAEEKRRESEVNIGGVERSFRFNAQKETESSLNDRRFFEEDQGERAEKKQQKNGKKLKTQTFQKSHPQLKMGKH